MAAGNQILPYSHTNGYDSVSALHFLAAIPNGWSSLDMPPAETIPAPTPPVPPPAPTPPTPPAPPSDCDQQCAVQTGWMANQFHDNDDIREVSGSSAEEC